MKNIYNLEKNVEQPIGYRIHTDEVCDICGFHGDVEFGTIKKRPYLFKLRGGKKGCSRCARKLGII